MNFDNSLHIVRYKFFVVHGGNRIDFTRIEFDRLMGSPLRFDWLGNMTAVRRIFETWTFNATSLPLKSLAFIGSQEQLEHELVLHVADQDGGGFCDVRFAYAFSWYAINDIIANDKKFLVKMVHETIQRAFLHEVDENILVKGERLRDPHR